MATEEEVVGFINRNNEKFKFKLPLIKCKDIVDLDSYIASKCNGNSSTPILDDSDSDDIIDISGKADKVTSDFEAGDVVILDSNGNITSGGSKVTDFAGVSHTHSVSDITDLSSLFDESDSDDITINDVTNTVTLDSNKLITSGGVYTYIQNFSGLTIDAGLSTSSRNAVRNNVITNALNNKLSYLNYISIKKTNDGYSWDNEGEEEETLSYIMSGCRKNGNNYYGLCAVRGEDTSSNVHMFVGWVEITKTSEDDVDMYGDVQNTTNTFSITLYVGDKKLTTSIAEYTRNGTYICNAITSTSAPSIF